MPFHFSISSFSTRGYEKRVIFGLRIIFWPPLLRRRQKEKSKQRLTLSCRGFYFTSLRLYIHDVQPVPIVVRTLTAFFPRSSSWCFGRPSSPATLARTEPEREGGRGNRSSLNVHPHAADVAKQAEVMEKKKRLTP